MSSDRAHDQVRPEAATGWSRRAFFASGAAAAGATLYAAQPARADAEPERGFAMITDTHANLDTATRTERLRRVLAHIAERTPSCVLNCGDITDFGTEDAFALYRSCVPDSLWPRMHHVPGNHEEQWNTDALEAYRAVFGQTRHSFDAGGLYFVGIDPLVSQEWSWHFTDDLISWIQEDLDSQPPEKPVVLFNHFPMAANWFYIKNAERFLHLLEDYNIRVLFSGHAHHLQVDRFNGVTQVVGDAIKDKARYYWGTRSTSGNGKDVLTITEVTVNADGSATEEVVATAPLDGPGPAGELGPLDATLTVADDGLDLQVKTASEASEVAYQMYPQGAAPEPWEKLQQGNGSWHGTAALDGMVPGLHRISVRAKDSSGAAFSDILPFEIEPTGVKVAWTTPLRGRIQADLVAHGNLVVVGTVDGDLQALRISASRAQLQWSHTTGGIYRGPRFSADGATVYVPSADHHLYAYGSDSGKLRWKHDVGAPVEADLCVTTIDGAEHVLATAGERLFCLTAQGEVAWQATLRGTFAGQPACDGERVFAASSTSDAFGFEARTGKRLWTTRCTDVDDAYHQILNGPWAARIRLSEAGEVFVPTVRRVLKLDPADGTKLWDVPGIRGAAFTPPWSPPAACSSSREGAGPPYCSTSRPARPCGPTRPCREAAARARSAPPIPTNC